MYYEDLIDNNFEDETSVEFRLRQKETLNALKKLDKYYEKHSVLFNDVWTDGKYRKYIMVDNYGSGPYGSLVRNAVTGITYNIKVGSKDEDLLFKVNLTTCHPKRREPLTLYYDSPEEYEKHHLTYVPNVIKEKWIKRTLHMQKRQRLTV
jgi:hypothetical protein